MSQTKVVKGRVTDGKEPLPGVSVKIKNTNTGTITNVNGEFSINASGNDILVLSFIGYTSKEVPVGGKSFISETLAEGDSQLGEVVVVGYGVQKKATVTGAISTVKGEDLVKAPVAGISNALIGMAPGLQAVQNSGEFGNDKATIYIRGMATLNGSGRNPLIMVDGVVRETYNNLDPNEIESINILKDASATAVFGVRGANGAIIITTKQGKIGKPQVSVSSNLAAIQPTILPELLGSYDYAMLHNEAARNSGVAPRFTEEDIRLYQTGEDPIFHPSKNWIDEMIKPFSFQQNYNANVSGGTEKLRYFTSLGYFSQSGGYHQPEQGFGFPYKHKYDKYNIRMNFDFNPVKDLTISVRLGNQITNNHIPNGGAWGAFDKAANLPPMTSPGFVEGKYIEKILGLPSGVPNYNPWGQAGPTSTGGAFVTEDYSSTLNTNLVINYDLGRFVKGLSVRATGAYDSYYMKSATRRKYFPAYTIMKDPDNPAGYIMYQSSDTGPFYGLSESISDGNKWRKMYTEAAIDYKRSFGKHNVTALALGNFEYAYYPNMQFKLPTGYLGAVGRVTYDYANRYMAEINGGYNGSENFMEGKRFGFFPAFSLGWTVTEEPWMPKNKVLTFLKFRGSYGEVGNDKIGGKRYLYLDGPYYLTNGDFQAVVFGEAGSNMARYNMYREGDLGNPDVTWERARKMDVGAEMRFFSDRLTFIGDYFTEKRDNILWTLNTVPELVSAVLPAANIGKVENKGYELELGWKDRVGKLDYWVKGAYSVAQNKIIYQDEPTNLPHEYLRRTGRPLSQYFGLIFEGFYNTQEEIDDPRRPKSDWEGAGLKPGDMKYKDLNGDGRITVNDMGPVGYSNWPEVTYSVSAGAAWKGFDISMLFQGTDRVSVSFSSAAAYPFTSEWGSAQKWHLERWTPERYAAGEKISFPRVELSPDKQHNYQPSSFWIQDASYVRLKNLELGYRFSSKALQRIGLKSMRVYMSGNNLITWSNMKYAKDPDARELWGRVYPSMRVYNGGVNFQF
ncbi:SusC/RagA family TonB-linked outer membrane protein [Chitinophaga alhagiae]|uniref:SusC/RagA family TonB-linked outer membrane protein n=1 Tax=Chitinophaga alhagiae TaxID=2203219 RepID=UPI001E3CE452|nr:TonB-dependent receptor [Chitinophaga alhagiae]